MLHVHHTLGDPDLGGVFVQDELRSEDLIIVRSRHEGGVLDEALEQAVTSGGTAWSMVRFVLEGPVLCGQGARAVVVERGEAFAATAWGVAPARSLAPASELLVVAWRAGGPLGPRLPEGGLLRLAPASRDALFRLAHAMAAREPTFIDRAVRDAVAGLRAAGVPLALDVPVSPVAPAYQDFAHALERVLFPMPSQPMAVDLARALGVCERQALRRANDHFRRFHISVSSWREYVHGMRVGLGTFFMGQRRARTEHVSRLLGFASPTSFCHAFQEAGLPSPLAVQRELLAS